MFCPRGVARGRASGNLWSQRYHNVAASDFDSDPELELRDAANLAVTFATNDDGGDGFCASRGV